ncbi:MAG TPA: 5'-methylthioadenosine/adenosylhomocysteine nucleosidase, partial [Candidatus Deferrimicrobium sp.]|nr:5'-methylthioadenosine/adenosylhomocysteine nucleosidase [Candidatus Deferrimicrobium sp.]
MLQGYEPIGIIATFEGVIDFLLHDLVLKQTIIKSKLTFYRGRLYNHRVVLVRGGVGKVNAARCATLLIDTLSIKSIIVLGLAGSLVETLHIGDLVISEDVMQHDVDATALGLPLGTLPGTQLRAIRADSRLVELAMEASRYVLGGDNHKGRILTGDQFIVDAKQVTFLRNLLNGVCVEMEGAAVAQVCDIAGIPYVVVRCIAESHSSPKYPNFTQAAARKCAVVIREML